MTLAGTPIRVERAPESARPKAGEQVAIGHRAPAGVLEPQPLCLERWCGTSETHSALRPRSGHRDPIARRPPAISMTSWVVSTEYTRDGRASSTSRWATDDSSRMSTASVNTRRRIQRAAPRLRSRQSPRRRLARQRPASLTAVRRAILAPFLTRHPEPPALVSDQPDCFNIADIEPRLPLRRYRGFADS